MPIRLDFVQDAVANRGLVSTAELYHENTKIRAWEADWAGEFFSPGLTSVYRLVKDPFKLYLGRPQIKLPRGPLSAGGWLLRRRRSVREFTGESISRARLGALLFRACGITGFEHIQDHDYLLLRACPSGGALYPIEAYPIVLSGTHLAPGIYHYAPREHALELLKPGEFREELLEITFKQPPVCTASVVVVLTAITARNMFKYGERGYRYILLDAGHLAQNLYLAATSLRLGAVTIGGFVDDRLNKLLEVDGVNEFALYLFVAGRPRRPPLSTRLWKRFAAHVAQWRARTARNATWS